ncbi:putative cytochrome P450 [Cladorrhinum sp. PSN332]|nr:putative cytochrome P450 [Cladorrhinum sp. PSN332]
MAFTTSMLYTASALAAVAAFFYLKAIIQNYLSARTLGIPVIILPIDHTNPFWMLLDRPVLRILKRHLPFVRKTNFARYNYRGWEVHDRYRSHRELGDAFAIVTPWRNWLYLGDPDALTELFRRGRDFPRCGELTEVVDVFGTNVVSAGGERWKIQRKVISTCFTEQNYEVLWAESIDLASDMVKYWGRSGPVKTIAPDTQTLSLNVLSRVGFGKSRKFEGHTEKQASDPSRGYTEALETILENCVLIMAFGPKTLSRLRAFLPRKLAQCAAACDTFFKYMSRVYEAEKKAAADSCASSSLNDYNFMAELVRGSQAKVNPLTEEEVYGNMFMINFAAHDSTAHTFGFVIYFLAAHPEVQDWVADELHEVLGPNPQEWNYQRAFPKLKRTLAILYETLRLYNPMPINKWTEDKTQVLKVKDKVITIPPQTMIIPSYASIQSEPKWWGEDSLEWKPQRWVDNNGDWVPAKKGTYIGWSEGPRDCAGRKFSQVEIVATLAVLLRDWTVEPVLAGKETPAEARQRVLNVIEESTPVVLLQMNHPERTPLVWKRR